ncbi:MAG: hypothetical protein RR744_00465 [Cellulosilyticaceae bacterium]
MRSVVLVASTLLELNSMINEAMSTDSVLAVNVGGDKNGGFYAQLTIEERGLI